jgi:hypothetical protein
MKIENAIGLKKKPLECEDWLINLQCFGVLHSTKYPLKNKHLHNKMQVLVF